jgi:hypothetical protein
MFDEHTQWTERPCYPEAGSYNYQVTEHYNGEVRSILGELTEQFFAQVER